MGHTTCRGPCEDQNKLWEPGWKTYVHPCLNTIKVSIKIMNSVLQFFYYFHVV